MNIFIRVSEETRKELNLLKIETDSKTVSETIKLLIDFYKRKV